jgi:hypothetical protein
VETQVADSVSVTCCWMSTGSADPSVRWTPAPRPSLTASAPWRRVVYRANAAVRPPAR